MSKANDTQVGGTHYNQKDKPQHWDLVQMYGWDYFQGQITKYLMRWKTKHNTPEGRLEDLKKARHFLDKYIELQQANVVRVTEGQGTSNEKILADMHENIRRQLAKEAESLARNEKQIYARSLLPQDCTQVSNEHFQCEGYYGDNTQLYKCLRCGANLRAGGLFEAEVQHRVCAAEPTSGYVNQG